MMDACSVMVLIQWLILTRGSCSALITENYAFKQLKAVPENLNKNVEYLTLKNNEIKTITKTSLANYPNLIQSNLKNNAMRNIRDGSFDQNAKLQILQLRGNSLRYIPANFGPAQISLVTINLNLSMKKSWRIWILEIFRPCGFYGCVPILWSHSMRAIYQRSWLLFVLAKICSRQCPIFPHMHPT